MTTNLCPCADLDWRGADMTLPHHPECKWFTVKIPYDRVEVQTVTIDAPPVGGTIDAPIILPLELADPLEYWRFGESGAVPFDDSIDSVEVSNRALTQGELLEMAHKKLAEVDFVNDKLVAYEPVILPMGLNDSLMPDDEFIREYKAAGGAVQVVPRGKFYALGYTTNHEWRNVTTAVDFLHCGLNQKVTFSGFKRELSCVKCEAVACFPDDFEF